MKHQVAGGVYPKLPFAATAIENIYLINSYLKSEKERRREGEKEKDNDRQIGRRADTKGTPHAKAW